MFLGYIVAVSNAIKEHANEEYHDEVTGHGDQFRHCWVTCALVRATGPLISAVIGLMKEVGDKIAGDTNEAIIKDIQSNKEGWTCGHNLALSCEECCNEKFPPYKKPTNPRTPEAPLGKNVCDRGTKAAKAREQQRLDGPKLNDNKGKSGTQPWNFDGAKWYEKNSKGAKVGQCEEECETSAHLHYALDKSGKSPGREDIKKRCADECGKGLRSLVGG